MVKFLIPLAATSTMAFALPASAQYYPQPQPQPVPHGYGAPGYGAPGYGYNHRRDFGHARALQARVDRIQHEIRRLAQYRMISPGEYRSLRNQSRQIERRLRRDARDGRGLDWREAQNIQRRIARLEYRVARDARDGRRYAYGRRW